MQKQPIRALMVGASLLASSAAMAQQAREDSPELLNGASVQADGRRDATRMPSADSNTGAEEIIVTAQNRSQDVQDVPIAMSVLSGDTLKDAGVTDFTSVQKVAPSLQVTSDTTKTRITVRGVGSLANNESQDQSIAVDIDGEYINRPTILNAAIFDIQRVEVLRGPQGTLYGRNTTGGAVNFVTRKPGSDFALNASATYGNYNQVLLEGGVDVPLGNIGGVRFAGMYTDHDGYFHHSNTPLSLPQFQSRDTGNSGDEHSWAGRATLQLDPTDALSVTAAVEHFEQDFHPAAQAYVDLNAQGNGPGPNCSQNGYVEVGQNTPGTQCIPASTNFLDHIDRSTYDSPLTGIGIFHQDSTAIRGKLAYDFGPATLTYTGGYRTSENTGENALGPAYVFTNFGETIDTQSHELRLNGMFSGVEWQTGIFYFEEELDTDGGLYNPFIGDQGSYIGYYKHPIDSKSWSGFGQVEVPIVDKVKAIGGLRYTKDKRNAVYSDYGLIFNSGPVQITQPADNPQDLNYSGDKVNWLAGLNYEPNDDTLVYAKVSTGYKAGGFDSVGRFKPETNTAYEGGLKLSYGRDSANTFNIDGFYYDYRNLQSTVVLDSAIGEQVFNAGKATIWGIEAQTQIYLSDNDRFNASFNYLHARYDDFLASYAVFDPDDPNRTSLNTEDNPNLAGNRLPQAPEVTIAVGYKHIFELGSAGKLVANANTQFKSDYYLGFFNYHDARQKAYTKTDLSLEYTPSNEHFSVRAFVRNLEDTRQLTFANYQAAGPDDAFNWQFGAPRTYGVRLSVNY